jgi:hypothetical protein
MIFKDEELGDAIQNIMNTFSGSDGGVRYIKFRVTLEYLETLADNDAAAAHIIEIVKQFSRLIDASQNKGMT